MAEQLTVEAALENVEAVMPKDSGKHARQARLKKQVLTSEQAETVALSVIEAASDGTLTEVETVETDVPAVDPAELTGEDEITEGAGAIEMVVVGEGVIMGEVVPAEVEEESIPDDGPEPVAVTDAVAAAMATLNKTSKKRGAKKPAAKKTELTKGGHARLTAQMILDIFAEFTSNEDATDDTVAAMFNLHKATVIGVRRAAPDLVRRYEADLVALGQPYTEKILLETAPTFVKKEPLTAVDKEVMAAVLGDEDEPETEEVEGEEPEIEGDGEEAEETEIEEDEDEEAL